MHSSFGIRPGIRNCLMHDPSWRFSLLLMVSIFLGVPAADARAAEEGWIDLTGSQSFDAWNSPTGAWAFVADVHLNPDDPKRLAAEPGTGVLYNGPTGRTTNL